MPKISWAASKQPLPCLCPAILICAKWDPPCSLPSLHTVVKWKQSLSSHYFKPFNGFPKPTRSHTVSEKKTLNQPMGHPAIHLTPTLPPRLFPCLHCEHLSPVSSSSTSCPGSREPLSHSYLPCGLSSEASLHLFTGLLDHYILPTLQSAPKANWARLSTLSW